jgi:hypothetical protein
LIKRKYTKSLKINLQPGKVCIPAVLSDDRTSVTLSNGVTWVCVVSFEKGTKNGRYFVKAGMQKPFEEVVSLDEKYGVMENMSSHIPIKCKLENLQKLIQLRGRKVDKI